MGADFWDCILPWRETFASQGQDETKLADAGQRADYSMSWHSNACLARLLRVNGHLHWRAWTRRMMTLLRVLRRNPVVQVQVSIVLVCFGVLCTVYACEGGTLMIGVVKFILPFLAFLASLVRLSSDDWWLECISNAFKCRCSESGARKVSAMRCE